MGLTLNEQKTRAVHGRTEPFTFLGYTFGPMHFRKDGHWSLGAAPAQKAVQRVKGRIRGMFPAGQSGALGPWVPPALDAALRRVGELLHLRHAVDGLPGAEHLFFFSCDTSCGERTRSPREGRSASRVLGCLARVWVSLRGVRLAPPAHAGG